MPEHTPFTLPPGNGAKVCVGGGAGFIGSNILAALEERGAGKLVVCDRLRSGTKWHNIAKRELADIVHPEQLFEFLEANRKHMEVIFHMGAISATTETDADKILANNFSLSLALWKWCALNNVRFIYASSAATYGDGAQGFDDDWTMDHLAKLRPLNAYGWSKHLFDRRVSRKVLSGSRRLPQWAGDRNCGDRGEVVPTTCPHRANPILWGLH